MRRGSLVLLAGLAVGAMAGATRAESFAVNDGTSFYVSSSGLITPTASAIQTGGVDVLSASGPGYSDAGIVLYLDGSLKLSDLQSVSVTSTGSPLSLNLWVDTGGDGSFFSFNGTLFTGLNGDSYVGTNTADIDESTTFYALGGSIPGGETLSALQSAYGGDATALWIGLTSPGSATISAVDVNGADVAPVPLPATALTGMTLLGLLGAGALFWRGRLVS